jgi:hypothetical protein
MRRPFPISGMLAKDYRHSRTEALEIRLVADSAAERVENRVALKAPQCALRG